MDIGRRFAVAKPIEWFPAVNLGTASSGQTFSCHQRWRQKWRRPFVIIPETNRGMNLEYLRWSIGALSRPSWTHCGFERKLQHEKAPRSQPPADGSPWSRWMVAHRSLANVAR